METMNIQSVAEKNIVSVVLADIQPSNYNPRKNFDVASLAELAESIRQQGVLQPIGVRPIAENRFEIIFGERRYRASLMAGLEEIPAIVLNVSDETAEEMAVTENLQRKDVTPIEEANAYQRLIESGRHDIQSLAMQFGKNETYIRTRLKFVSLIPEIAELLEKDEITISVASEICRYGEDIQREVFDKHLKEGIMFGSWRGMKATEVAKNIERHFTTDLERYNFDKTLCLSCPHNTNNMTLFCEGTCGKCANKGCLDEMNAAFLTEKAIETIKAYPALSLSHDAYCYNADAVNRLKEMGYEVVALQCRYKDYPTLPEEPEAGEYDTEDEYKEAKVEYEQDMNDYMERSTVLVEALPYIQKYYGKTVVIKYGGNAMISEHLKDSVIRDICLLQLIGVKVVLVHGGGPEITDVLGKMGKKSTFVDGVRVTDEEAVGVALMVLAGKINKTLVNLIELKGGSAIGLSGLDGHMLEAKIKKPELGYVGEITNVNVKPILDVLDKGYIPVVSTVGYDDAGNIYNINADTAAARIAGGLGAESLIAMTDIAGILKDKDDPSTLISSIRVDELPGLVSSGVIQGGMIPKAECCRSAIEWGVNRVFIIDGRVPHAILIEMLTNEGIGTMFTR